MLRKRKLPGDSGPATLELLYPPDGSVTQPLQQHQWPPPAPEEGLPPDPAPVLASFRWDDLEIVAADRSFPTPIRFQWSRHRHGWKHVRYELTIARSPDLTRGVIVHRELPHPARDVWNLHIGTTYYWRVRAHAGGVLDAESAIACFTTNSNPPRWINVPGITNVRDIGGWPVPGDRRIRQGQVYRGSEMNGHIQITPEGRRVLEDELAIRTDLDLRGDYEGASPVLNLDRVQWIHAPISPYDSICDDAFRDDYRLIFQTFARPENYPILVHCVGGADRSGTVAFLLNALLGKSREHLIHDYELTTLSVWGERSRWSDQFRSLVDALRPFSTHPEDTREQSENYLLSIGVTAREIDAIRRILIEDNKPAPHTAP